MDSSLAEYLALWKHSGVNTPPQLFALRHSPGPAASDLAPEVFASLGEVQEWLGDCRRCGLCHGRRKIVFGSGNAKTRLLFVGEGPGADEDASGEPFVGKAGGLLTKILEAMHYKREEVYIANVVKCRPPQNRVPSPEEVTACAPFLKAQIEVIDPALIIALGLTAAVALTGKTSTMSNLRGRLHPLLWRPEIAVLPTYHPAYLLRNPDAKRVVWDDMKIALAHLGKTL